MHGGNFWGRRHRPGTEARKFVKGPVALEAGRRVQIWLCAVLNHVLNVQIKEGYSGNGNIYWKSVQRLPKPKSILTEHLRTRSLSISCNL